jgi:hypothetical protein
MLLKLVVKGTLEVVLDVFGDDLEVALGPLFRGDDASINLVDDLILPPLVGSVELAHLFHEELDVLLRGRSVGVGGHWESECTQEKWGSKVRGYWVQHLQRTIESPDPSNRV